MWLFLIKQSLKRIPHYCLPLSCFFLFLLVISPFSSSVNSSHASLQRAGGGHSREGTAGPGENPTSKHVHTQQSSSGFKMDGVRNPPRAGSEGRVCFVLPGKRGALGGLL